MTTRRRRLDPPHTRSARGRRWLSATVLVVAAAFATGVTRGQSGPPTLGGDEANPNFDIRAFKDTPRVADNAAIADFVATVVNQSVETPRALAVSRGAGVARLKAAVGDVAVDEHPTLRTVEVVGVRPGGAFLTGPSTNRVATLRAFLQTYADAYGITASDGQSLDLVANYANPAGNMAWVELEQRFHGIPVFQGLLRGGFTAKGELARTTGILASGVAPPAPSTAPVVSAGQAVALAADSVGWSLNENDLTQTSEAGAAKVTFGATPVADGIRAWQVYFPLAAGVVRLAWATEIMGDPDAFLTVIDADTGTMLFRKNLTSYQTQSATYNVYNDDSPAPSSPTTLLPGSATQAPVIPRTSLTLIGNEGVNAFNNLGWMTDGTNLTDGNNVEAGLDILAPNGVDAPVAGAARVFNFSYNPGPGNPPPGDNPATVPYRNGDVTNMFYWVNRYHDATYLLGFTEAARNFQTNNFGRGGAGADRISAETQDSSGTNNANFSTPADGGRGRMQMFVWTGPTPDRSGGLDQDIILHELTHGLSNRLHGNAAGLSTNMSRGMGEGWSDFYARALLSTPGENANGIFTVGGWATHLVMAGFTDNYYYGIRRFPYAPRTNVGANGKPHSPLTFADIDQTKIDLTDGAFPRGPIGVSTADQVHNIGEVWAGMLWEVRVRFIARLGFAGNQRLLQYVTDGMKLDPIGPTMLQARDAIIAAANAGVGSPAEKAADVADIWAGFAARGLGFGAQITNAGTGSGNTRVVESFDVPGVLGTTSTITFEGLPDGHLDPGEFAAVSFCMTNAGAAPSGSVTGTLLASGGVASPSGAQSYGVIAPGGSVCRTFTFVVSATCGTSLTPSLQTAESGGPTKTFTYPPFQVGTLVTSFAQTFDGVVAPALPAGWTTSTLTGAANAWVTNTTTPDTAPNRAFSAGPGTVSDSVLVTPTIALPAGANRMSFRNNFNTEPTFDGGVLEIQIGGGAFQDILAAGGTFVSGGYNATIANSFDSPIAGRQAWSGNSAGYITTVVTMPAAAGGQDVQLRWRMATDVSVTSPGWAVDSVSIGSFACVAIAGPAAANDAFSTAFNTPLTVAAPGVLGNDTGSTPLTASLGANVTHGTLALGANGGFTYTPAAGFSGTDSFTYQANNAGGPSNLATVTLTVNAPTTAQPPAGLHVSSMVGNIVTFRWTPPAVGPAATGFVLEAGLNPNEVIASLPLGTVPSFTVASPSASYFVRVHTLSGVDKSAASNEIHVHVNVPVAPSPPENLLGTVAGSSLTLAWTNTFGGAAPTSLILDVTGAVSGSLPMGLSDTFSLGGVPPGTYTLSLRATNAAGVSAPSNAVTLTFPGGCSGAPQPPSDFLAFNIGSTAFLAWETAPTGPAPDSFVLDVTGSFVGAFPVGGRSLSGAVPPGSYSFRLQAVNGCGASGFTPVQTIVVP